MASPTTTAPTRLDLGWITQPDHLSKRQLAVVVGPDPTATISFLSSALVAARASATVLQQQLQQQALSVQQLQAASISTVASLQNELALATNSANLAVASASSSAAIAVANLSNSLADANSRASLASVAAMTDAQDRASVAQGTTTFSVAEITIAIAVSIVGAVLLTSLVFLAFMYNRRQREQRRVVDRKTPDNRTTSMGSMESNTSQITLLQKRGSAASMPPELGELHLGRRTNSPDLMDCMTEALHVHSKHEQRRRPDWPLPLDSPEHQPHAKTSSEHR